MFSARVIPHKNQRYKTVGDWIVADNGDVEILVSDSGSTDTNLLVAVHELVEVELCKRRGISQAAVDEFDKTYEERRLPGDGSEPGNDPAAPYHKEHVFAELVERMLAREMGLNWDEHDARVLSIGEKE